MKEDSVVASGEQIARPQPEAGVAANLLPCPFCGCAIRMKYDPRREYYGPDGDHAGTCPIGLDFVDYADPCQAEREWNTRAEYAAPLLALAHRVVRLANEAGIAGPLAEEARAAIAKATLSHGVAS